MSRHTAALVRGASRHEVQFYDDETYLIDSLVSYVMTGFADGETCVVIATRPHIRQLESRLIRAGINLKDMAAAGRYFVRDAQATLDKFIVDGQPDAAKFQKVVGSLVAKAAATGAPIRAYGEMVALLWAQGNATGLARLEELWNQLAKSHAFTLVCGYSMGSFREAGTAGAFEQIVHSHNCVTPAESFAAGSDAAGQAGYIAALQQKVAALVAEQARLIQLNQAKDEFISIASHQLRTPATGVKQYIGMVLEGYFGELNPKQEHYLSKAYESNERQIKVVNDLLLTAKVDAGNIHLTSTEYDIAQLVNDVVDEQQTEIAKRSQSIGLELPNQLMAHIDPLYIRMVVENLVSNASKYSPHETEIKVAARRTKQAIEISVRDHGIGISREDQLKLYKKFSRIYNDQSVVEGNGLGLYWSKKIVELHGGALLLASRLGQGSTFTVLLPV